MLYFTSLLTLAHFLMELVRCGGQWYQRLQAEMWYFLWANSSNQSINQSINHLFENTGSKR